MSREPALLGRYLMCGAAATASHFLVLAICVELLGVKPVGLANLVAAIFGSLVSFLGNRYFTFQAHEHPIIGQFVRFALLYVAGALWHGVGLYLWSDVNGWDYRSGFVVVTALQVIVLYIGNRFFVFARRMGGG